MERGEHFKRIEQPTMAQIQYLLELEKCGQTKGVQGSIAKICGVNPSTVYRFFNTCIEKGILDENLKFTEYGQVWIDKYRNLIERLTNYLTNIGGNENEVRESMKQMIEHIDIYMLERMLLNYEQQKSVSVSRHRRLDSEVIGNIQRYNHYKVKYGIYKLNKRLNDSPFSMAMNGFEKKGSILWEDGEAYLVLHLKDMEARSRLNGQEMVGHLDILKYEENNVLTAARMTNGNIYIPLSACAIHYYDNGNIIAKVAITVRCSVGHQHMPESTALMFFWL